MSLVRLYFLHNYADSLKSSEFIDFGIEFVKAEVSVFVSITAFHTAVQLRLAASLNCDACKSVAPSTQHVPKMNLKGSHHLGK